MRRRALVVAALGLLLGAGCGKDDEPGPDEAVVELDGVTTTVALDDCGVDGDTVYLVGQSEGRALQVVLGVVQTGEAEVDGEVVPVLEGDPNASGVTFWGAGAFGALGFDRAGGGPQDRRPGNIEEISLDGSHIVIRATAEPLDDDGLRRGATATSGDAVALTVDANCPETATA